MFGITEIINKLLNKKELTEEEKFKLLRSKKIDIKVVEYLISKLSNLHIEVLGKYEGSLFELMPLGKLEGWCWQTTESAIVFLNDTDYIERGNLYFDEHTKKYYHSWICFTYKGTEYILDPCLSFLCKKSDYHKVFKVDVHAKIYALSVKKELIKQVTTPKVEDTSESHKAFESFLKTYMGEAYESYKESKKNEVVIDGPEDVTTPFYRNGAGYKTELDNGIIKKLTVHYYDNNC